MIEKQFKGGREYFKMRNYKYESIFHIAGKNNALESLKYITGRSVWIDEMLKRDYEGNTPLHSAAKAGNLEILTWFCEHITRGFLEIQNDFGFTPLQAAQEKAYLYDEQVLRPYGELAESQVEAYRTKYNKCMKCVQMLGSFETFVTDETWNDQFELRLDTYLEQVASVNMRIFMGMPKPTDLQIASAKGKKKAMVQPEGSEVGIAVDEENAV